jgi:Uncharacterized protein conserved in bacteria (DUF2325)
LIVPLSRARSADRKWGEAPVRLIKLEPRPDIVLTTGELADSSFQPVKRRRIWELAETLHCSIVGTCLSTTDLRHVLVRLTVAGAATADDHDLHVLGVTLAGRREAGAKLLQKALDRRHGVVIKRYSVAETDGALRTLWEESVRQGDIPGGYWALLSHPAATEEVIKKAFRDVHMLSHLVGAANRADIRRLRQLEEENSRLTETLHRQQQLLRDGFTSRDQTIRRLNETLARRIEQPAEPSAANPASCEDIETFAEMIGELSKKLDQETSRRQRLERRLQAATADSRHAQAAARCLEEERDALRRDLELIEQRVMGLLQPAAADHAGDIDLSGSTILYVGGRANQVPGLKALVERTGGRFLHHDGGIEHNPTLLPGLISRADHVFFPTDCISHDAAATIKRLCGQLEKRYAPLRAASLASLLAGLSGLASNGHDAITAAQRF